MFIQHVHIGEKVMSSCSYLYAGKEVGNNNRNWEGNIHLVWSHCSSFLLQAKLRQQETVMDDGPAFLKWSSGIFSALLFNKFCQGTETCIAFTVKSSVYCLWCNRDLPFSFPLSSSNGWKCDECICVCTCTMYV